MAAHRECGSSVLLDNIDSVHHILAGGCCAYNATHVFDLVVETEARVSGGCLHHTVHVRGQSKLNTGSARNREREGHLEGHRLHELGGTGGSICLVTAAASHEDSH